MPQKDERSETDFPSKHLHQVASYYLTHYNMGYNIATASWLLVNDLVTRYTCIHIRTQFFETDGLDSYNISADTAMCVYCYLLPRSQCSPSHSSAHWLCSVHKVLHTWLHLMHDHGLTARFHTAQNQPFNPLFNWHNWSKQLQYTALIAMENQYRNNVYRTLLYHESCYSKVKSLKQKYFVFFQ